MHSPADAVKLWLEDNGQVMSSRGDVADVSGLGPRVLIGIDIIAGMLAAPARICRFARRILKDGHGYVTPDGMLRIDATDRTIRYELFPAEWSDTADGKPYLYLGVEL